MADLPQIIVTGLALGGLYALMASGLTLIFGVMRIVNLAHPAFIFISAYITWKLFTDLSIDPLVALAVTMPVMFVFGMIVYKLFFAREADNPRYIEITVLTTFALALIIEGVLGFIFKGTVRSTNPPYSQQAFFIGDIFLSRAQLYAGLIGIGLIAFLWVILQYTRIGYAIRATTQNRSAAQVVGVNVERTSMIAFGLGVAMAGAAGSLFSFVFTFFPGGHWEWLAILLALIVLGGMGSLPGAVIGAYLLTIASVFVNDQIGFKWGPMTFFLALFIVLMVRPQGLFGSKIEAT
ncbi:MAG: branched-chain amino acid ABC transporter permease [Chloroflexi bacterium]|nr:MAG: branched-chain amino acid ABC transporter permease [Chloroflexota bacterium]